MINKKNLGIAIALVTAVVHGAWPAAARAVYADGGNASFMVIASIFARAMGLNLYCFLSHKRLFPSRRDLRLAVTGGFLQALHNICMFAALLYLPAPVVITLFFTHTLLLLFFLAWRREIKLNFLILLTTVVALAGLSFVVDIWHPQTINVLGLCLALVSVVSTTSRFYVYGHQTQARNPAVIGAENFLFAALFTVPILFFSAPNLPVTIQGAGWAVFGCALLTIGCFGMFYGIAFLGSFQYSLLAKMEPLFTALFSALLVNEVLHTSQYVGMMLLIGSLVIYQFCVSKRQRAEALAAVEAS